MPDRQFSLLSPWCGTVLSLIFSASMVLAQVPTLGQSPTEDGGEESQAATDTVQVDGIADDAAIESRLQKIFNSTGWFENVEVKADNGVVTLSGTADSVEHKQWAADVSRRTQDVVATVDKIAVDSAIDLESSAGIVSESLHTLWQDFLRRSPLLTAATIVFLLTVVLSKLSVLILSRVLENRRMRTGLKDLVVQLTSIGIWIFGLLIAVVIAFPGMTPSRALTVLGLGSIAIGFAFKDIFENFFAGILILWRYPFDRGDFISYGDLVGKVEQITVRNTLIRRLDGELAVVPNANLFKNDVDVLTNHPQRRVRITCGIAYDENVDEAREVIRNAVTACSTVQGKRTIEVFAEEFADSSINFEVAWWTGSKPIDIRRSRDEVVAAIKRALNEANIEIPYPYRTLTFKNPAIGESFTNRTSKPASEDE